jgi:peroxiredoxin
MPSVKPTAHDGLPREIRNPVQLTDTHYFKTLEKGPHIRALFLLKVLEISSCIYYYSVMKKIMRSLIICMILLSIIPLSSYAAASEQDRLAAITKVKLKLPDDPGAAASLGIKQKDGQITLNDIDAEVIIIEIFSMYCPFCQRHAPMTNKLQTVIETRSDTRGKVKLLGIGVGNSPYEVKFFKKKYGIQFPLFDDANSAVLNSLPDIRTPYYFAIRKTGRSLNVFFTQQGAFEDPEKFLNTVLNKSGQLPGRSQ